MHLTRTHEIFSTKISLLKVGVNGKQQSEILKGFERFPPTRGEPYVVYLGKGKILRTSPVKEIQEVHNALMLKTANSVYRLNYLG